MQKSPAGHAPVFLRILPVAVIAVGLLFVAGVHWRFAPVCRLVAGLSGHEVWVEPAVLDLGRRRAGTVASESVAIRNYSGRAMEVMGANVSCGCTQVLGVPCTITDSGMVRIPIAVRITNKQALLRERVSFIVNDRGEIKNYLVSIRGQVVLSGSR